MQSRAVPALTRLGFRRDVRLFLTILVGFLAALIVVLIFSLQSTLATMHDAIWSRENDLATIAAVEIPAMVARGDLEPQLVSIRTRYGFDAVEVRLPGGRTITSGATYDLETIERHTGNLHIRFFFDPAAYLALRRRFMLTAGVSIVATALGIALLFLYLPKILEPVEKLLDQAKALGERGEGTDETKYLLDTFRRLIEREKRRADDLQTITSTLTRSLTSGFIALDPEHHLVEANAAAREIAGADPLGDDSEFKRVLLEAAASRAPISRREVTHGEKTIGLTTVPLFDAGEKFLGTLALFTDLTQVRRLESRVREMQTLADLGVMSAGIAHEFRNSLSTILGLLKLAARAQPPPEIATKLKAAETEASQLADAVTSLLNFAKPMELQVADVNLRELIDGVVARLRDIAPDVVLSVDGSGAVISGDAVLLSRAFENIVRNAIDAVADQPKRDVHIDVDGAARRVTVIDTGVGIAGDAKANLFLPFYSTKQNGVGIGLPLARKILLLHGASIEFDSQPGRTAAIIEFQG